MNAHESVESDPLDEDNTTGDDYMGCGDSWCHICGSEPGVDPDDDWEDYD